MESTHKPVPGPYKVNPIEIIVFLGVCAVFANSLVALFHDSQGLKALISNASHSDRQPASLHGATAGIEIRDGIELDCFQHGLFKTQSESISISGSLCKPNFGGRVPKKITLLNTTNNANATIFTDSEKDRFQTSLIPVVTGSNAFRIDFDFGLGATESREFTVRKD